MKINFVVLLLAALIPLVIGFLWYNPKTFGTAWMKSADITEDKMKGANMGKIFALTYLFSVFAAFALQFMVIHQYHIYSTLANEPGLNEAGTEANNMFTNFMTRYGSNFRTFKHGAFHGFMAGITLALPVLGVNAMFERKGFNYIVINVGFWCVCFALMGGVICQWA